MFDALAALAQTLLYVGIALGAGGVIAEMTLRPDDGAALTLRRLVVLGSGIVIVAALLGLGLLMLRLGDALDAAILSAVLTSNVGGAAGLRIAGATLLLVMPQVDDDAFSRGMRASAALIVVASFLFSGHAAADSLALGVLAAIHVAIVGWWLSSLLVLRKSCDAAPGAAVHLVRRFSLLAVIAIAVLVIAGGLMILGLVDVAAFEFTPYVRNLAIKLAIVVVVFAVAAYNKFALTARVLAGDVAALRALRRSIDVELVLIAAVLIATAIMTTFTSPHE